MFADIRLLFHLTMVKESLLPMRLWRRGQTIITLKKNKHHREERRPDGEKKSSVLPLIGNVNITKMWAW